MHIENFNKKTVIVKLALVAISLGITILVTDCLLRLFADKLLYYREHEMFIEKWPELPLVLRYKKDVDYSGETYGDLAAMIGDRRFREKRHIVFKTDSFGFRNNEMTSNSKAYDLIVLGDSYGVGNGTTQDRTWVALLNARYQYQPYNLSIPGSPWQSYVHLATEIDRLPVHRESIILLTIFSGNDLDDDYYPIVNLSDLPRNNAVERLKVRIGTFVSRSPIIQLVSRLRHENASANYVLAKDFVNGRKLLFYQPYVTSKNRTEVMVKAHPNYYKLLDTIWEIRRITNERNLKLVILMLPSKEEVYEWVLEGNQPWSRNAGPSGFAAALEDFCRQNNLSFFDLKPSLLAASEKEYKESGEPIYWTDDTHWNEKGHSIVADIVYRAIFTSFSTIPNKEMNTYEGGTPLLPSR